MRLGETVVDATVDFISQENAANEIKRVDAE